MNALNSDYDKDLHLDFFLNRISYFIFWEY